MNSGRFEAGTSGNPNGRPKGARNKATVAVEALLEGEAEALTRRAIDLALGGDTTALRLCMDRLMPVRKDRPIIFELPEIREAADLPKATNALLHGVAAGEITPSEAAELSRLIDSHVKAIEAGELARRLSDLEQAAGGRK